MRNVSDKITEKINGTAGEAAGDNITRRMRFAYWVTNGADTHSQNMQYLLVFRGNSGYANAL